MRKSARPTVVVAMSGGVDSSVTAWLLKQQGYEVIGLYAWCWDERDKLADNNQNCKLSEQDYQDMVYTASYLDIPYFSVNLTTEYRQHVLADLIAGYRRGYAPNPDILCNRYIKFQDIYHHALHYGMDYFATGHYARLINGQLYKGVDRLKDQSYFLYAVRPKILTKVLFPLGEMSKSEVRSIAAEAGLPTAHKKDSMGICFVGPHKFSEFLAQYIPQHPGDFVDLDGQVVGRHQGAHLYTIGQRRGLGLGGAGERWYVVRKDMSQNQVVVSRGICPEMFTSTIRAYSTRFVGFEPTLGTLYNWHAKIRHGGEDLECTVSCTRQSSQSTDTTESTYEAEVRFKHPQQALTAGQSVVFYADNRCMGGGIMGEPLL